MPYFRDRYNALSYPTSDGNRGLYNAQIGAIHAVGSHFTIDERPAIVTMPTGSGKTAVLMMTPFVLKSNRVLVITPSQFVRWQIAADFQVLETLKAAGAVPADLQPPRVLELTKRVEAEADWNRLLDYDVVVSTPNCTSPTYEQVPNPPEGLFDLILIDEAHHSPAETWAGLIDAFPNVPRVLFTATPFRRDRAEIRGKFVYTYPISRAYRDRIFGSIRYIPVEAGRDLAATDIAIARATEQQLLTDRASGFDHYVMVRTDRRTRADDLADIYSANTGLRLSVVHSALSPRRVRLVLDDLRARNLDGLICVNMLGEGFNFPKLKIAAIHSPHRSLEVTLQFIGRFARTNAPDIGEATFIGAKNEMEIEGQRLFEEGAVWQDIIPNLAHGRVEGERIVREALEEFDRAEEGDADFEDLSLYSIYPRSHVKVYEIFDPIDLRQDIPIPESMNVQYTNVNEAGTVRVMITRQVARPKWSSGDKIVDVAHDLIVIFVDADTRLMFINSSRSNEGLYDEMSEAVYPAARKLPTNMVRRVVQGIRNQRIFNVGMRNILATNTMESYRIIAGPDTQGAIKPSDARNYRQGHAFMAGEENGERVTIGYSSGSKVWAASNEQIPGIVNWCRQLGAKIRSNAPIVTHSGLDYLSPGVVADAIPQDLIHVQWHKDAFSFDPPIQVEYVRDDGMVERAHILDLELSIDRDHTDAEHITVTVSAPGLEYAVEFGMEEERDDFYSCVGNDPGRIRVFKGGGAGTLIQYLNGYYFDFYTASGALFSGNELFEPADHPPMIDLAQIELWNWNGVAIQSEVVAPRGRQSIHERVRDELRRGPSDIVLYDHGSGEIADFVTLRRLPDSVSVGFYHCKGSSGREPGARVNDVYEVCSQAQKSVSWANVPKLESRLRMRRLHTRFERGSADELRALLDFAKTVRTTFEVVVVQPGIRAAALTDGMKEPLGATDGHLRSGGCAPLRLIASA